MNNKKLLGQTFTAYNEVSKMLRMYTKNLLKSKILEPSFGDGAFLMHLFRTIILEARNKLMSDKEIINILDNNIYGFELDEKYFDMAISNLKSLLFDNKIDPNLMTFKNIKCISAFLDTEKNYDLIIGNPPYVRVQNFSSEMNKIKEGSSRITGNTDLYLLFIDFYLDRLQKNGEFIFIVPNSLGKSRAAKTIRDHMYNTGSIDYIDFEEKQLFQHASVYSAIFRFKNNSLDPSRFKIGYSGEWMTMENNGYYIPRNTFVIDEDLSVKNGIATLADYIFIHNVIDENWEKEFLYPIYKGSRMDKKYFAIFPYKIIDNSVVRFSNEEEFREKAPKLFEYMYNHKEALLNRSLEKKTHWFEYGRSQGIKDIMRKKIIINTLIKPNQRNLITKKIDANTLVYSGLYTITDVIDKYNNSLLITSLRFKAKDMRGGYKKISSSLLKKTC